MAKWNPWHGCRKYSEGCENCYVYRVDERHGKDSTQVTKIRDFNMPIAKNRRGEYKVKPGELVYTCFTSDFFIEEADEWRKDAWDMIRQRSDLKFLIITKRCLRFMDCIPSDWGEGYENVAICCTVENQKRADERLPVFVKLPIKHKYIICEPILTPIDLSPYLNDQIEQVVVGGESGQNARVCDYNWVLNIRRQCEEKEVAFYFKQTGAFFRKDNRVYRIKREYQHSQARRAGINYKHDGFEPKKDNNK